MKWHGEWAAALGIRVVGLAWLALAWVVGSHLYNRVHAHAVRPATPGELGLSFILVVSVLVGAALLLVGASLWKQVEIPGRSQYDLSETRQLRRLIDGTP